MIRKLAAALLITAAACTGAQAKDITVTFNDDEQKGLMALIDAATRAGGLQSAETAVYFVKKLQAAAAPATPAPVAAPASTASPDRSPPKPKQ